jgi:sulfur carrier protein
MQILLNGNPADIPGTLSARDLIERLELSGKRVALEVNGEIVPRSLQGDYRFKTGDKIEVIHAIGGG